MEFLTVITSDEKVPLPFYSKVLIAAVSGACGGVVGTPGDMVNVRMQNDMRVPKEQRRKYVFASEFTTYSYKHALDGVVRVAREEGPIKLFNGATMATSRAVFMTIGQVASYDQIKQMLIAASPTVFTDTPSTHFLASTLAVSCCANLSVTFAGGHRHDDHSAVGRHENAHDEREAG